MNRMSARKKIAILGGGFGGVRAAMVIAKKLKGLNLLAYYEVILLDRSEHHTYTPLLYEVATTSKETADIYRLHEVATHDLARITSHLPITLIRARVDTIDLPRASIHIAGGAPIHWDILAIALGSEVNFFGIPGLREYALTFKSFEDAIRIRNTLWNAAIEHQGDIKVAIGGGGSSGVELAGELMAWCGELQKEFPRCRLSVAIIEGAPTILPGFTQKVIAVARKRLARLGVKLIESETIESVERGRVILKSGQAMPFDVFIWAGGVKAPQLLRDASLKTETRGRLEVTREMECIPQPLISAFRQNAYALGDSVCVYHPKTRRPIAGVARAAISEANVVAHNVLEDIKSERNPSYTPFKKTFQPMDYPYIIPIGGKFAVAKIGPLVFSGLLGWLLKGLVELNYLLSIMPIISALKIWLQGLRIFIQNDRLG